MSFLTSLHLEALNALFPVSCLCCRRRSDNFLCARCADHIPLRTSQRCAVCQKREMPMGRVCTQCFLNAPLAGVWCATPYGDTVVKEVVHTYKYRFASSLAAPMGRVFVRALLLSDIPLPDIIIPVPLHTRRERWRGYNQSTLLAHELSRTLLGGEKIPVCETAVSRIRFTAPQAKRPDAKARKKNLAGAFRVAKDKETFIGKRVWLIDDVCTTASTLLECARTLQTADAREVYGITFAG